MVARTIFERRRKWKMQLVSTCEQKAKTLRKIHEFEQRWQSRFIK